MAEETDSGLLKSMENLVTDMQIPFLFVNGVFIFISLFQL